MSEESLSPEFVFKTFSSIYVDDVKFLVIRYLCNVTHASAREIARHVGISHKNLTSHLDYLESKGIIEVAYSRPNMRLYRTSAKASLLAKMFEKG